MLALLNGSDNFVNKDHKLDQSLCSYIGVEVNSLYSMKDRLDSFNIATNVQNLLIDYATGTKVEDDEYQKMRARLIEDHSISHLIPDLVKNYRSLKHFWPFIKDQFSTYADRRNFIYDKFKPLLDYLENSNSVPSELSIDSILKKFDSQSIHSVWQRALERKSTDPEGAITLARTLLESVCKHILDDLKVDYNKKNIDLSALYKKTATELNLSTSQHTEEIFKQILGSCSGVINGLGDLRNKLGDAHGKGKNAVIPAPRHAELSVNLAGSMALFLVQTFQAKSD